MQFPARLRVVTPTGIQFFAAPREAWDWAEGQSKLGPSRPPQSQKRKRFPCSRQWERATLTGSPTAQEAQKGRQEEVAAVASLGGSSPDPLSLLREASADGTDSGRDSISSIPFSDIRPVVTLGTTADEIIQS
ncbi:hypothetical protein NDU88_007068 [Pleurodeles waltl]|uniref:Uncharacterized protein n=1 Tax=Pleurodeles waltl TaxID=8319 RepID=A0AAV7PK91_PLEWA|nr:hypothetical protein NDU88_007068 [Pleurodeles waltl]